MQTLGELRADVRQRIDETNAAYWTDPTLDFWIAEACRDIARRTECLESVKVIPTVTEQIQYPAPDDAIRIHRIEYRDSGGSVYPLEFRPIDGMDNIWYTFRTASGVPAFWSWWGYPMVNETSQLYIYPSPSETLGEGLWVFYYRLPRKAEADDDPVDVPSGWEDLVALYCEYTARRKENSPQWRDAFDLYEGRIENLMGASRHFSDQATYVDGFTGTAAYLAGSDEGWW